MRIMDHKAEADRLLGVAAIERDSSWALVLTTRALVHATLAAIPAPIVMLPSMTRTSPQHVWPDPGPRIWSSTDHDVANEPVVVFQGDKVRAQRDLYAGEYLSNQDYA